MTHWDVMIPAHSQQKCWTECAASSLFTFCSSFSEICFWKSIKFLWSFKISLLQFSLQESLSVSHIAPTNIYSTRCDSQWFCCEKRMCLGRSRALVSLPYFQRWWFTFHFAASAATVCAAVAVLRLTTNYCLAHTQELSQDRCSSQGLWRVR